MPIQTPTENWFKFPNHIADNLASYTTFEVTILVLMLRRTVGMLGLTKTPDQRFSQSFLVKNTGISDSQVYRAKKSLIAKGAIKEDGTAGDGSKLYSVVWDIPVDTPLCPEEVAPSSCQSNPPPPARATDKDISLKTVETKTLDASASSTSFQKTEWRIEIEPLKKAHPLTDNALNDSKELIIEKQGKMANPQFEMEFILDDPQASLTLEEMKKDKIPYKEISDYFLKKHKEFRKVKSSEFMPKWNGPKETKAIKRLWEHFDLRFADTGNSTGTAPNLVCKSADVFIEYLKSGKGEYFSSTPILPSQITDAVLNRMLSFWEKVKTKPILEIKSYENKGIAIGPMPEGW